MGIFFAKFCIGGTYADSNLGDFRGEYNKSENDKFEIFEGGLKLEETYGEVYSNLKIINLNMI